MNILLKNNKKWSNANGASCTNRSVAYIGELTSGLYGTLYQLMSPEYYKRASKINYIKLRYAFIDGQITEEIEDDETFIDSITYRHEYKYNSYLDFLAKIHEISICEKVLNNTHWVFDSYLAYIFTDFGYKLKYDNKRVLRTNDISKVLSDVNKTKTNLSSPRFIIINNNKYKMFNNIDKLKHVSNNAIILIKISNNLYIRVNKNIIKFKGCRVKTEVKYFDELSGKYELLNEFIHDIPKNSIGLLLIAYWYVYVISRLESTQCELMWKVKNKLLNSKIKFSSFVEQFFPEL